MSIGTAAKRLKFLATGKTTMTDNTTGEVTDIRLPMNWRWTISGVHSHNWKWVNRWGKEPCGCVRNPLTRRKVLVRGDCPDHGLRRHRN